jgi:hypothetical protein
MNDPTAVGPHVLNTYADDGGAARTLIDCLGLALIAPRTQDTE